MRGDGRVWRPPGTQFYHMKVSVDGQVIVQSTGKTTEDEAERFKTKLLQNLRDGTAAPHEERIRLRDLRDLLVDNYTLMKRRSLDTMQSTFKQLEGFFGLTPARAHRK